MVRLEPSKEQLKGLSYIDCARWAASWAPNVWANMEPMVVWFEQPFGPQPKSNHQLSVMAGALLAGLPREVPVDFVSPGECRKLVGLSARTPKPKVVEWAVSESDADFEFDEHDADSFVVVRAILAHGAKEQSEEAA